MQQSVRLEKNRGFGASALAWSSRLPASAPIVSSDLQNVAHAFAEAARRRKCGDSFSASVLIDDARSRCALFVATPPVLAQVTDYDQRAGLLDAVAAGGLVLGGRTQADLERFDSRYIRTALELLVTADVVVTRSSVERESLCRLLARRFINMATIAPLDPTIPRPGGGSRNARSIVVWAASYPAEACGILAYALEEFHRPAVIVCAGGSPAPMREGTRFVSASEAPAALADAAVIVDASLTDPGCARALARWGVPLAASSTSGAADWLDGITVFDPWSHRSIQAAVVNALGNRSPRERCHDADYDDLALALAHATASLTERQPEPLVSVIVPTTNTRKSLHDAVASIVSQTYANFEIVLVNDGGAPIEPSTMNSPRELRLVEYGDRRGVAAAVNLGIAASHGKYIAILADDDLFCPNHLAQLVEPLERTGGDLAHAIELCEHFEQHAGAEFTLIGHSIINGEPASATRLQTHNVIGGPSIMFTRRAFDRVEPFDERGGSAMDLAMWMRMSVHFDFIHVDRVTAIMSMRSDTSQLSAVSGAQTASFYRYVYASHPTSRPAVAGARERHLHEVESIPVVRTLPQIRVGDHINP